MGHLFPSVPNPGNAGVEGKAVESGIMGPLAPPVYAVFGAMTFVVSIAEAVEDVGRTDEFHVRIQLRAGVASHRSQRTILPSICV